MPVDPDQTLRRRRWAAAASVALCLAGFVYFFVEWVDQTIDTGYGEHARRNPLLAAELFLEAEGIEAESVVGFKLLDDLPPTGDVLIVTGTRRALSERRTMALAGWVADGGHLVVVAEDEFNRETGKNPDRLLHELGVYLDECPPEVEDADDENEDSNEDSNEDNKDGEALERAAEDERVPEVDEELDDATEPVEKTLRDLIRENLAGQLSECWDDDAETTTVKLGENLAAELELNSCRGVWTYSQADAEVDLEFLEEPPTQLIQVAIGSGTVTAATSLAIFFNPRIHCADHAFLLRHLASHGGKTWLLADPDIPTLAALLFGAMPLACMSFALWLFAWAASRSLAIGPHLPTPAAPRRELLEHLEASAHFLWRQRLLAASFAELRDEIGQRARQRSRDFEAKNRGERAHALAEISGLPADRIDFAMAAEVPSKRQEFTIVMQTLQSIRRSL